MTTRKPANPAQPKLLPAIRAAVRSMPEQDKRDQATARLAEAYAHRIDTSEAKARELMATAREAVDGMPPELAAEVLTAAITGMVKARTELGWLGPHLAKSLDSLGLNPKARKDLAPAPAAPERKSLAQVLQLAAGSEQTMPE